MEKVKSRDGSVDFKANSKTRTAPKVLGDYQDENNQTMYILDNGTEQSKENYDKLWNPARMVIHPKNYKAEVKTRTFPLIKALLAIAIFSSCGTTESTRKMVYKIGVVTKYGIKPVTPMRDTIIHIGDSIKLIYKLKKG